MLQARLLDIAVSEFGRKGLDGASTRGIAKAADTAMSSITYHYGGKEGLYLAAADHVAERMSLDLAEPLAAEQAVSGDDPVAARAAIHRILATLIDRMAGEDSDGVTLFILREQMRPSAAFDRIYNGIMGQVTRLVTELICVASGDRDPRVAGIATMTLMGQVLVVRANRATTLRLLERERLSGQDIQDIKARIAANTDAIIDRLIAEERGTA